jgi:acyl-CoA thioester hydrolase
MSSFLGLTSEPGNEARAVRLRAIREVMSEIVPPEGLPRHDVVVTASAADIDELQHVSNLVYVRWVQEVAQAHSVAVGWDHARYFELGAIFVVRRHEIDYVAPVFAGEEVELTTWIAWWKGVSSQRRTRIRRRRDGQVVARAATLWAFVDLAAGRPRRIPEPIRAAFGPAAADVASSVA